MADHARIQAMNFAQRLISRDPSLCREAST